MGEKTESEFKEIRNSKPKQFCIITEVLCLIGLLLVLFWNREVFINGKLLAWIKLTFQYDLTFYVFLIVLTLAFLLLGKKKLHYIGLDFRNFCDHARTGLNLYPFVLLPMVPSLWTGYETWYGAILISLLCIPMFILIARLLQKGRFRWISGIRRLVLVPVTMFLLMVFLKFPYPTLKSAFFTFTHYFFFVGFGEELMFRGYVQTRLNAAFGKPYKLFGTPWGPGMVVSAAIFGLMHNLNADFNPFQHNYHLTIWWGVFTMAVGFVFGYIREKTASIIPGGIIHGLGDAFSQIFFNL